MVNTILQFLIGIGILQSLLLGLVLIAKPGMNKYVSRALATILFLTSLLMPSELFDLFDIKGFYRPLLNVSILIDLLLALLIWWLTPCIMGKKQIQKNGCIAFLAFFSGVSLDLYRF